MLKVSNTAWQTLYRGIKKLVNALHSPEVKKFILDKYKGAVVPAF